MAKAATKTRRWTAADDRLAVAWTMTLDDVAFALERTDREVLVRLRELDVLPTRPAGGGEGESGRGGETDGLPLSHSPTPPLATGPRVAELGGQPPRGAEAMPAAAAEGVARRVLFHLYRGSIDMARAALEDGWREHERQCQPLPLGAELLEEPLARVLDDVRLLNALEGAGLVTIGSLLAAGEADLLAIPNVGHRSVATLRDESQRLRQRAGLPAADPQPASGRILASRQLVGGPLNGQKYGIAPWSGIIVRRFARARWAAYYAPGPSWRDGRAFYVGEATNMQKARQLARAKGPTLFQRTSE